MAVSILHRATGVMMATVGTVVFVWWLVALAAGPDSYATFYSWIVRAAPDASALPRIANVLARLAAIGLSWAFFQHLANGVRHLFLDIGANFELRGNKRSSLATIAFALAATVVLWAFIFLRAA